MRRHPRNRQPGDRRLVGGVCAARPHRISHDRLPADFVEGDVLRAVAGGGCDGHHLLHARRVFHRPGQRLHAAHRSADHRRQRANAQMIEQPRLRRHHVGYGDHREVHRKRLTGPWISAGRARAAHAAAQHIGADHEPIIRVHRLARPHQPRPPAGLAGARVGAGNILIEREGVADQDGIGAIGVEPAIGFIGDGEIRQHAAAGQRKAARQGHAAIKAKAFIHQGNAQ